MNTITRCHCRVAVWWNIKHVIWHGRWSLPGMEILEKSLKGMSLSINFNQRGTLQEASDLPQDLTDPRWFVFAHPKASRTPPCSPDRHAELRVGWSKEQTMEWGLESQWDFREPHALLGARQMLPMYLNLDDKSWTDFIPFYSLKKENTRN